MSRATLVHRRPLIGASSFVVALVIGLSACADSEERPPLPVQREHAALIELWTEWRAYEQPDFDGFVPDYSASAMARQRAELPVWMDRLRAFDTSDWSIAEQVDWQLVRAEMNGLDFDHQIRLVQISNAVEAFEGETDSSADGKGAAGEARATASRGDGEANFPGES